MSQGQYVRGAQRPKRPTRRLGMGVRVTLFVVGALAAAAVPAAAYLDVGVTTTGSYSAAIADSLNGGNTPTLPSGGVNGENVTIQWTASKTAHDALGATGYTINRYSTMTGGTAIPATGGCAGTVAALTCTEQNVPPGNWWYTVTPLYDSWTGTESERLAVTVTAPSFSITSGQSVSSVSGGSITGGTLAHFGNTENVTFHLDSPGGTTLTTSPSTVTTSGTGTASGLTINILSGTAIGNHTIVAVGATSGLTATSNTFNVYGTAAKLVLTAQTTTPTAGAGDNLTITAEDSGGNTVSNYTGLHTLSFTGASSIGSFNPTVTNSSGTATAFNATPNTAITFTNGVATVSGSSNGQMVLYKVQTASIVVSDGSVNNGSGLSVTVIAANVALSFSPSCSSYSTQDKGKAFSYNVARAATDPYGNPDPNAGSALTINMTATSATWSSSSVAMNASQTTSGPDIATNTNANNTGVMLTGTAATSGYTAATCSYTTTNSAPPTVASSLLTSKTDTTTGHSSTTASVTTTSGATDLILVYRSSNAANDSVTSITGPVTGVTQVGTGNFQFTTDTYLWAYMATGNGTSGAVTVNFNASDSNNVTVIDVIQLSGNNTSGPVPQSVTNSGSTSPTIGLLTNPNSINGEIEFVGLQGGQPTITTPSGMTKLDGQTGTNGGGFVMGTYFVNGALGSESGALSAAHPWGTIAIELNHG